tara:strand:+ start:140 stop:697 length:558 start_codon:yes stop_codon:yes gene_type:complete
MKNTVEAVEILAVVMSFVKTVHVFVMPTLLLLATGHARTSTLTTNIVALATKLAQTAHSAFKRNAPTPGPEIFCCGDTTSPMEFVPSLSIRMGTLTLAATSKRTLHLVRRPLQPPILILPAAPSLQNSTKMDDGYGQNGSSIPPQIKFMPLHPTTKGIFMSLDCWEQAESLEISILEMALFLSQR